MLNIKVKDHLVLQLLSKHSTAPPGPLKWSIKSCKWLNQRHIHFCSMACISSLGNSSYQRRNYDVPQDGGDALRTWHEPGIITAPDGATQARCAGVTPAFYLPATIQDWQSSDVRAVTHWYNFIWYVIETSWLSEATEGDLTSTD